MLDRIDWFELTEEQNLGIVKAVNEVSGEIQYHLDSTVVKLGELPFYKDVLLLEIDDPSMEEKIGPLWFIQHDGLMPHLDGSSAPVHDMNELADIQLTEKTVVDYVHFFGFFVHGEEGPFFVVEDTDFPAFDKKKIDFKELKKIKDSCKELELVGVTDKGIFELTGTVLYGNALFGVRFAVTKNGMIELIDDEPLMADIPVRKIKPNY